MEVAIGCLPCGVRSRFRIYLTEYIYQKVLGSQLPYTIVNLFLILVIVQGTLTNMCENRLLQNDFINTFCEIRIQGAGFEVHGFGFRVPDLGPYRDSGMIVSGFGCRVEKVLGSGFRVSGFRSRVSGFRRPAGFRVRGSGFGGLPQHVLSAMESVHW